MLRRVAFIASCALLLPALPAATLLGLAACSSSSSSSPDSGAEGGSSGSSGGSSGGSGSGGMLPVGDGGPCVVATSLTDAQVPPFVLPNVMKGACTSQQITDFLNACTGSTASPAACDGFQSDGGACLECLLPRVDGGGALNTGAVLVDYTGKIILAVNSPGCIALSDPDAGLACATGLEPYFQCETQACGSDDCRAADAATCNACLSASQAGVCAGEYAASAPCAAEYSDGGAAYGTGPCASPSQVLDRICGSGM